MSADHDDERVGLWRELRRPDVRIGIIVGASIMVGLALAGLALVGAWGWAALTAERYMRVRDDYLVVAFAICGIAWVIILARLWSRALRDRHIARAALATAAIAVVTPVIGVMIDAVLRREEEYLIGAVVLGAGAVTLRIWLSAIIHAGHGKPLTTSENLINVHCPECGYSLLGLHELRCPECGTQFTIDELIRRQNYGAVRGVSRRRAERAPHDAETLRG
jgi:predicted RNA-binding Zn-ribbon protein involved in translation (DUF1610 family)